MKKRQNEPNGLLHCKNCDAYYDPSLPNCPRCGEETANNTMDGNNGHISIDQYGGGYGPPGSPFSRASLFIIIVLLLIALATMVWLCVQALSQATPDNGATSAQVEVDPADASAQGAISDSAAASSSAPAQEPEDEDEIVAAETLTLDFYDLTLSEGESYDLTATVSPTEWEGDFAWSSDDESVATVKQNGLVTYVSEGQCTVTVSAGGLTAQCVIRCNAPAQAEETEETKQTEEETDKTDEDDETEENTGSIVLEYTDITLTHVGDGYTFKPSGGNGTYTWSSADTSIATVNASGYVTGVSKGTTTVTCTSGSETVTIIVRVAPN
ncbi:MAG: Ig-like domain-containing protein [Clostridiales bacterium]|nr:Ig-like domain-containing protein [Clostridiales bacterium]